jgi:predicted unusual protein kinase regulating ubiquinone biosynthesis (AarF/ABC1/UbiB family)
VLDELDLEHESTMQRRAHRAVRNHAELYVPAPVSELAHENVLVSEWIDGVPLTQAADADAAAEKLVRFGLGAAHAGFVHADLTPADVIVMNDGRVAVLDFGASAVIPRDRTAAMAAAVEAFAADDEASFADALAQLGSLPPEHAGTALRFTRQALGELAADHPSRLDSEAVIAARERALGQIDELTTLLAFGKLPPEDLWPSRGAAQLFATIARVGASGRWLDGVREALRTGF